jgi:hypothetical protein
VWGVGWLGGGSLSSSIYLTYIHTGGFRWGFYCSWTLAFVVGREKCSRGKCEISPLAKTPKVFNEMKEYFITI